MKAYWWFIANDPELAGIVRQRGRGHVFTPGEPLCLFLNWATS